MSLYGPKPADCPAPFEDCGRCNIYPCLMLDGPVPAPGTENGAFDRLNIEIQAVNAKLIQMLLDKESHK